MASDINVVTIIGRLAREAELKYTNSGTPVCNFSIASNASQKGQDGQYSDVGHFFDCVLWGKVGEALNQYLTKGQQVGIQGRLEQQKWLDQATGQNRSKVVINVREIELLASVGGAQAPQRQQQAYAQPPQRAPQPPQQQRGHVTPPRPQQAPQQAQYNTERGGYYTPPAPDLEGPETFFGDEIPF